MASLVIGGRALSRPRPFSIPAILVAQPVLTVLLVAATMTIINPIGFIGGGGDEYQYLLAARCTAEHGFCLPHDHWWRRWPVVAPSGLAIRLFGEGYWSIALTPLLYAVACLATFTTVMRRQFGPVAATIAGATFAVTPIMTEITLEMGIDMPELLFTLLTVAGVQAAYARGNVRAIAWAGLAAGLAIQARPTGLTLLPVFFALFALTGRARWAMPFALMAALPSVAEALVYAAVAGDPLLGWKLSLAHVRVPSTELLPTVDTHHSPLFNPEYISGWRRPMGLHVHWTVDGLINYLAHPAAAVSLMAALILLVLERRRLGRPDRGGPALLFALALGVAWFGALTYGFAIDPKPRMFLPTLACACAAFGVLAPTRWANSRALVVGAVALVAVKGLIAAYERFSLTAYCANAPALIAAAGPGLAVDGRTAQFLALVPQAQALPRFIGRHDQRKLLLIGQESCINAAREAEYFGWTPRLAYGQALHEPALITAQRERRMFFSPGIVPVMCVLTR